MTLSIVSGFGRIHPNIAVYVLARLAEQKEIAS